MKEFHRQNKVLHIWLFTAALILLAFFALRLFRPIMNLWVDRVLPPVKHVLANVSHLVSFSVAELLILLLILLCFLLFLREIRRARKARGGHPWFMLAYRSFVGLVAVFLSVYAGFALLYGTMFFADDFQTRSGIHARGGTVDELAVLTMHFANGLNETAALVPRNDAGVFDASIAQIFEESVHVFRPFEEAFPFMAHNGRVPKPLLSSPLMALTSYTGFYFPFTAEANINTRTPRAQIPATVLHEFAHQRRISSEDEANFIAILAGIMGENPVFSYSAYLMGYSYLAHALNRAAPERFREIHLGLHPYVQADLQDIRDYHARQSPIAITVSNVIYDHFLQSFGEAEGIESYGAVVDLLFAYFFDHTELHRLHVSPVTAAD